MKNLPQILIGFVIIIAYGFVSVNPDKKRILELEKELAALKQTTNCSTKKVLDGDLYKFLEENQKNVNLNAVKVKAADMQSSLKNFAPEKFIYIAIADTKIEGRTVVVTGVNTDGATAVCHISAITPGRPRCCPPPLIGCMPGSGEINNVHFVSNEFPYPKGNMKSIELTTE